MGLKLVWKGCKPLPRVRRGKYHQRNCQRRDCAAVGFLAGCLLGAEGCAEPATLIPGPRGRCHAAGAGALPGSCPAQPPTAFGPVARAERVRAFALFCVPLRWIQQRLVHLWWFFSTRTPSSLSLQQAAEEVPRQLLVVGVRLPPLGVKYTQHHEMQSVPMTWFVPFPK